MVEANSDAQRYAKIQLENAMAKLAEFTKAGLLTPDNRRMTKAEVFERYGSDVNYAAIDPEISDKNKTFSGSIEFDDKEEAKNGN